MPWLFLKVFIALGNDRPQILFDLEDQVLLAIASICEGRSREDVMENLCSQLRALESKLVEDEDALTWFHFDHAAHARSSTPPPEHQSKFLPGTHPLPMLIIHSTIIHTTVTPQIPKGNFPGQCQTFIAKGGKKC
jgi:hypothetical protein